MLWPRVIGQGEVKGERGLRTMSKGEHKRNIGLDTCWQFEPPGTALAHF